MPHDFSLVERYFLIFDCNLLYIITVIFTVYKSSQLTYEGVFYGYYQDPL